MMWIALVVGLSGEPTFRGAYTLADCLNVVRHVNRVYGSMVHAECITLDEARRLGYTPKEKPNG